MSFYPFNPPSYTTGKDGLPLRIPFSEKLPARQVIEAEIIEDDIPVSRLIEILPETKYVTSIITHQFRRDVISRAAHALVTKNAQDVASFLMGAQLMMDVVNPE